MKIFSSIVLFYNFSVLVTNNGNKICITNYRIASQFRQSILYERVILTSKIFNGICEESMRELILILMTCYKRYQFEIILNLIVKILKIDDLMEGKKKMSMLIMFCY